jgi:phospholipid/cholesterol/gamma-HCH transport system ATP-binding protein
MIELINIRKQFEPNGRWITDGVNLSLPKGSSTCIIGASGEGKSVLLKQIIGLIRPSEGSVIIDGLNVTELTDDELTKVFEKCGYVFQFAALLDSLTIFENLTLSLQEKKVDAKEQIITAQNALRQVNLTEDIFSKYPSEISGGMKKRVALARTLITKPLVILYDEPTTGLDPITTRIVHELMQSTHKDLEITSVIVSHDIEIFAYVDYVAFLYKGKIQYFGKASEIWDSSDQYIYQFIRGLTKGPLTQN